MRPIRDDEPGAWWLITNRGLAKRPVFETRQDVERFLAFIGDAVARGEIEVHAYTILTTHFHLLARSPRGAISEAMRRITNDYVRWFNRSRRRDGPLFRGRFDGRRIRDPVQWSTVLRYIDRNPVRARMVAAASDHPHGSARAYRWGGGPDWLERHEVERVVCDAFERDVFVPEDTDPFSAAVDDDLVAHLVEHTHRSSRRPLPALADLVRAASDRQQRWMEWKAVLADATAPGTAFLSPQAARRAARVAARTLRRRPRPSSRSDMARDLEAAYLRHAAGLTLREVAAELGLSSSAIPGALRRHELRMVDVAGYEELVMRVLRSAVRRAFPTKGRATHLPVRVKLGAGRAVELPGAVPE